ncbi:MAG: GHKL domain-containing protein [Clostridia bacterium]|nr:GHKL domain-containing protein [Clostridia bacterium]
MDWTLSNTAMKKIFDVITLGEFMVLLTMYFRPRRNGAWIWELAGMLAVGSIMCAYLNAKWNFDITTLIFELGIFSFLYSVISLKGHTLYKAVICLYFATTYFQLHSAELVFWNIVAPNAGFSRLFLAQAGMCMVLWANKRLRVNYCEDMPRSYIVAILASTCATLSMCLLTLPDMVPFPEYNALSMTLALGTMLANMSAFYLGQQLFCAYREKLELINIRNRMENDERLLDETQRLYDEMRTLRHEMQNHALVLRMLCDSGDLDAMREKLDEMLPEQGDLQDVPDCGNLLVNTVLSRERVRAGRVNILISQDVHLPDELPIAHGDLCSLFSNLLSNAMEGSHGVPDADIKISARVVKNYLRVAVANRVERDVFRENPGLNTTKGDPGRHGVGIPVIRRIVERYDGILHFSVQEGYFVAEAFLKLTGADKTR